jgi:diguanylate cyclase (GGDEF)-like protein/PAS domain S-box-containing protein
VERSGDFNADARGLLRLWLRLGPVEQALVTAAIAFGLARVADLLAPPGEPGLLPFWPVSGLLLAALLLTPRRRWAAICAGGLAGTLAFNLAPHGAAIALAFGVGNVVMPVAGAFAVARISGLPPDMCRLRDAAAVILGGAVFASALSGVVPAAALAAHGREPFLEAWGMWALTNAGAVLLITPMLVSWAHDGLPAGLRARATIAVLVFATAALAAPLLFGTTVPLAWVVLVLPVAAALRYGVVATSLTVFPWVVVALIATAESRGIYASSASSVREAVLYAQASTGTGTLVCVSLGAVAAQLRRALRRLRHSEENVRLLVEGVRDHAMFMLDREDRIASWNAGAKRMLGYEREAMVGRPVRDLLCHALDRGDEELRFRATVEQERWVRRADGSTFLGRFAAHPVRALDSEPGRRALVLRDVTEARRAEQELRHMALHDSLTGLPNRNLLHDRLVVALGQARREGQSVGVLFLDLDRFKLINDSLGHASGDDVLREVAGRLRGLVRPGDTVARFGGDEFVLCCQDIGGERGAIRIAERIEAELARPMRLSEELFVHASVGIAIADGGATADDLIRGADTAMYRAKRSGDGHALVDESDQTRAMGRLRAEAEVRRALPRGELELQYLPIVDLSSGRPVSVEALLRWNHPERGRLAPGEFIPLAEETGAIVDMGLWALEEACRAGHRLREPAGMAELRLNVNVSARQLAQPGFVEAVGAVLGRTTTDPRRLCLELTETTLIEDLPANAEVLGGLKRIGVSVAMDDFGTGYSSLGYLRRLPVDQLKLDRSFVTEIDDAADGAPILRAAVAMAQALDVDLVAEGVEQPSQTAALAGLGYRLGQGFHFARPMTEAATGEWLAGARRGERGRRLRVVG